MVYLETSDKQFKAEEENKVKLQKRQLRRSKIFAIVLGSAAIVAMGLTVYSQMLKTEAVKQEQEANKQKEIALEQQKIAEEQTIIAQEQEKIALEQKEVADQQKQIAVEKEQEATRNYEIAQQQTNLAIEREKEANEQRTLAEENAEEARKQSIAAEKARQEAFQRRMLSISQSMAVKSRQISDNTQLKALVAYQSYIFNESFEGPKHNPDVYLGLYYALKGLKGQFHNALNGHTGSVMDIAFVPGSSIMYSTGGDGKIIKWDIDNLEKPFETIIENTLSQRSLGITPDGKWMICAKDDGKILFLNLTNNVEVDRELEGHTRMVSSVVIAPNNKFFISASNDKTIRKWDLNTLESEIFIQSDSKINSIEISRDSELILAGTQDGRIGIYNASDTSDMKIIENKVNAAISALKYNREGNWLATGDSKGNVVIRDAKSFEEIENLEGHKSRIYDIDFNIDDNQMATSSLDGTVRIWDCTNLNNQPIELTDHESWVLSIAFTPDGKKLVTSSNQKDRIIVWSTKMEYIAEDLKTRITRNMSNEEWNVYVAEDIEYEKTLANIN